MAAAPEMREKIDIPALAPESRETGDRRFEPGRMTSAASAGRVSPLLTMTTRTSPSK